MVLAELPAPRDQQDRLGHQAHKAVKGPQDPDRLDPRGRRDLLGSRVLQVLLEQRDLREVLQGLPVQRVPPGPLDRLAVPRERLVQQVRRDLQGPQEGRQEQRAPLDLQERRDSKVRKDLLVRRALQAVRELLARLVNSVPPALWVLQDSKGQRALLVLQARLEQLGKSVRLVRQDKLARLGRQEFKALLDSSVLRDKRLRAHKAQRALRDRRAPLADRQDLRDNLDPRDPLAGQ